MFSPKFFYISIVAILTIALSSCFKNKDAATINLNFSLEWFGQSTAIGDTVIYQDNLPLRLEKFLFYIEDISIKDENGNWLNSGSIDRIEFMPNNETTSAEFSAKTVRRGIEINAIKFGLGVGGFYNSLDRAPENFGNDHPLGIVQSAGMYWDWDRGYIFTKFEGKIAETFDGSILTPFSFHTGTDDLYREVIIELKNSMVVAAEETHDFNVVIDLGASISTTEDQIDLLDNCLTHTLNNPELAERFVNLLDDAWKIIE
tara:strand:+ start:714 stop:1490 length:777 start_codon:yes stop_codon:yes gene_type:complete